MSKITSIATGVPAHKYLQTDLLAFADKAYNNSEIDSRKLKFLYGKSGISHRHSVLPDFFADIAEPELFSPHHTPLPVPDISKRMSIFNNYAPALSAETINKCISGKIDQSEITHLITVSCTGISAPGLDLQVMELMKLPNNIIRTSVNFMGCYAAVHAMKIADAFCKVSEEANVVIVCTEFCTIHFQNEPTIDNLTASLLFGDGCAAMLMQGNGKLKGVQIENFFSHVSFEGKKDMAWEVSSKGFLMTLSGYVPDLIKADFEKLVLSALAKTGRSKEDVTDWCIHPGGAKILEAISDSLGLKKKALDNSYEVLRDYGNMSSPTVLFVLEKILNATRTDPSGEKVVFGAAFGPGLTMETFTATYG